MCSGALRRQPGSLSDAQVIRRAVAHEIVGWVGGVQPTVSPRKGRWWAALR
jgi:hypothetical protein